MKTTNEKFGKQSLKTLDSSSRTSSVRTTDAGYIIILFNIFMVFVVTMQSLFVKSVIISVIKSVIKSVINYLSEIIINFFTQNNKAYLKIMHLIKIKVKYTSNYWHLNN